MATLLDPTTGDVHTVDDTLVGFYANQGWQPVEQPAEDETATELEGADAAPEEEVAPTKGGRRRAAAETTTTTEEQ